MNTKYFISFFCLFITVYSCTTEKQIQWPSKTAQISGSAFYSASATMNWKQRDSLAFEAFDNGNTPDFFKKFKPVHTSIYDSSTGKTIKATYYVSPDYFSIGTNNNWARVCITPQTAQRIADRLNCFLPTIKMVDDIYQAAKIKLAPVPMLAFRDSTPVMWQHHLIIEGQRQGKKGLIAGIKKDVVISEKVALNTKPDRVAIYGWHQTNGKPIQPLYTGHVNWYVDYSQGTRLVYNYIKVNGRNMHYTDVLKHPILKKLLCNEELCNFYKYY